MKNVFSVVAGLITGFIVIMLVEFISHKMYPLPPNLDLSHPETIPFLIEMMPMGAFLMILLAYSLGSFTGGLVSAFISQKIQQPLIVGGILMLAGIANLFMLPHPLWFAIVSLLMYLPFAFLGGKTGIVINGCYAKNKNKPLITRIFFIILIFSTH